jgi:DNA-binding NtrC family response regulator
MPADTEQTRVFIVEDEQSLADVYDAWLADEYDTRVAYSGEAALEGIANHSIDVVLLDRRMPGLSGGEVANRLDENGCDAQVIMVTAVSPSPEMAALPINDYIQKPVEREQLLSIVETAALVRTYDDDITELLALTARRQVLEEAIPTDELEASEQFDRLLSRINRIQGSIDDTMEKLWVHSDTNVFERIARQIDR